MSKGKKPIGYAEDAQIKEWKKQHGTPRVHEIETQDDEGNIHVTYLRDPDFDMLQMLTKKAKQDEEMQALKTIFNSLRIGGSNQVKGDYYMEFSAIQAAGELLKAKKATAKKR